MANDIRQFSLSLEQFSKKLGIAVTTVQKKIAFDLFRRIVARTPVDTGRARASWTIAVNKPDRSVAAVEGNAAYQTGDAPSPAAGAMAVNAAGSSLANLKPYDTVWISNNLPYIGTLESGHSRQAPYGMVALSVEETKAELRAIERVALREAGL